MAKQDKKNKGKKSMAKKSMANPGIANDQLGENASETMPHTYDNKKPKKK